MTILFHPDSFSDVWGNPEEDNRDLWVLLDDALHDQDNAMFGDMLVYFCCGLKSRNGIGRGASGAGCFQYLIGLSNDVLGRSII